MLFLKNLGWLLQNVMDGCIPEAIRRNVFRNSCYLKARALKGQNQDKGTGGSSFMGEWALEGTDLRMDL